MYKDVLLPIDLGHESTWRKSLPAAVAQCRAFGARLHVMTVVPDYGLSMVAQYFPADHEARARAAANERLHALTSEHVPAGIAVQHVVAQGTIYEEILAIARRLSCDLIVMTAHRPELRDYLLGPNAARVVRHADCSVLVVRE